MAADGGWAIRCLSGTVGELHALTPDADVGREVWLMSPTDTALALGSAQSGEVARPPRADECRVVRRRSGGGAVLVAPDNSVWIDVVIGRGDQLWRDDVNQAPIWLGEVWAEALASMGVSPGQVCNRYEPGAWGRLACFASRGPGEVVVGGAKAVGITQRRTRNTARFQTLLYRRWEPEELIARLTVPPGHGAGLRAELADTALAVNADIDEIHSAFLTALP